jgi:glycogen phosphorylase
VSHRDVQGTNPVPGAEEPPHDLSTVPDRCRCSPAAGGHLGFADQTALRHADAREVEQNTEVAGETEPAGMCQSLAVAEEGVGAPSNRREGVEERGDLAEGEEPGDIGESRPAAAVGSLDETPALDIQDHDRGDQLLALAGDVASGDPTQPSPVQRFFPYPPLEPLLDAGRLPRGKGPGVQGSRSHGPILPVRSPGCKEATSCYSYRFCRPMNGCGYAGPSVGRTEECMPTVRTFRVIPNLPDRLIPLSILARNLWWTWTPEAADLFRRMDPDQWEKNHHNPVALLGSLTQDRLEALASDEAFLGNLDRMVGDLNAYLVRKTWFERAHGDATGLQVAYFSAEFGLHESLPIYSGGLGVLAGDHLKSASDLGLPLVGVGLLYRRGYFRQYLNRDGWQQEMHPEYDFERLPLHPEMVDGQPRRISVEIAGREVVAQVWRAQVGRIPLILLDSDLPENTPEDRAITDELYGGDLRHRIRQEILLGMGGVRALQSMGYAPTVFHMNEGHSAFLAIERIRQAIEKEGLGFAEALEEVRASSVFTTHTPVPAGHDVFPAELMREHFGQLCSRMGILFDTLMRLGRARPEDTNEPFCMTVLALRSTSQANGVSQLHGSVSRKIWTTLFPKVPVDEIPIGHVTNGIHIPSWYSREVARLFSRYLGPRWQEDPVDRLVWQRVDRIPDGELWRARERIRDSFVSYARKRLQEQLHRRGMPLAVVRAAEEALDPDALTIGFARRFAVYKRASLLFRDPDRLARLLNDPDRPVQIVFAGKAHPADHPGKQVMREIVHFAAELRFRRKIVFLEDYDMEVARQLVQGADVWLNTPRRPLEASGTSGMKAVVSGALHLSVLDGWWAEAYTPETGWAIGNGEEYEDPEAQDQVESEALYDLLEQEVVPLYYRRGADGLPRGWIEMMKASMRAHCPVFNTDRMVEEYSRCEYLPAHVRSSFVAHDVHSGARQLAAWRRKMEEAWSSVAIEQVATGDGDRPVGDEMPVRVLVRLGGLMPEEVVVEAVHGDVDGGGELHGTESVSLAPADRRDGAVVFQGAVPCSRTGLRGLAVRVRPAPRLNVENAFEGGFLTWWEADPQRKA